MKLIYENTVDKLTILEEGKLLYKYLLNYDLFEKTIINKISEKDLTQDEFEILLYSFRFILCTQMNNNNNNFYNRLLKENTSLFIKENYIPGSFPYINEYIKSYYDLKEQLVKGDEIGHYICKDCGYLYEVPYCSFPMSESKCINGHIIGGNHHICHKMDIRVFFDKEDDDQLRKEWTDNRWHDSFLHKTLEEYKKEYVDNYIDINEKGIISGFRINDFEKKEFKGDISIITFRTLNFILYSYLLGAYILDHLDKENMEKYLIKYLEPESLFGVIIKGWKLLENSLKEIGIENVQIFLNMTFENIISIMNKVELIDTVDKLKEFQKEVDEYIKGIITNEDNIKQMNKEYNELNNDLINCNPQNIREIIQSNYEPSIYDQNLYPDIQYYSLSNIIDFNTFAEKFNSSKENQNKYALINILVNKELDIINGAMNMKSLDNINRLVNIMLNIYSYKISRDNAKKYILKNELNYIIKTYNEINTIKINDEDIFIKDYIDPFIESWNIIKNKAIQYKCKLLRDFGKGENPLEMNIDIPIYYYLVDKGDQDGGMFLAAAYQNYIEWQNKFIDQIISKNSIKGILNSYVSQLEQEINVQDATNEEIINIDDNIYKILDDLILSNSMRNIFTSDNKINYKNYNEIIYNYDSIEEELGKIILPGLKKFKNDKIKFVIYLGETLQGDNSSILLDYNTKYNQENLSEEEKNSINKLINLDNGSKFDIFSSLSILMNQILNENYEQGYIIYKIIESLPSYIILNEELVKLFKEKYDNNEKMFSINCLVSLFEYFEALCWNDIKNKIPQDYQLELSEEIKGYILDYFEKNKNTLINKKNLTVCLRKLISRYLASSRQEIEIKSDSELKQYIGREDLWSKDILNSDSFDNEIEEIFKLEINIGQSFNLYNLLEGDAILNEELYNKEKEKEKEKNKEELKDNNIINTNSDNKEDNDNTKKEKDEENEEEEGEEEEEEREDIK